MKLTLTRQQEARLEQHLVEIGRVDRPAGGVEPEAADSQLGRNRLDAFRRDIRRVPLRTQAEVDVSSQGRQPDDAADVRDLSPSCVSALSGMRRVGSPQSREVSNFPPEQAFS